MNMISKLGAAALVALCSTSQAGTLDWSFQGESGTFTTSGNIQAGTAGTFTITDFSVAGTAVGATVGSEGSGAYHTGDFITNEPYTLDWNGSTVTNWHQSGTNTFNWLTYRDVATGKDYFFGWASPNVNTIDSAAYFQLGIGALTEGLMTFTPATAAVPEPANLALMALGLVAVGVSARRARRGA